MSFLIKYLFWEQQYQPFSQHPKPQPQLTKKQKAMVVLQNLEEKIADFESKEIALGAKMQVLKQSTKDYLNLGKKLEAKYALDQAVMIQKAIEGYRSRVILLRGKWNQLRQSIEDSLVVELMEKANECIVAQQAK